MDPKLNPQNTMKLINLYRSYPLLWDMNSKSYRRNDLKTKAYENIANEIGMTAEVIKKKIRSLRTTYTGEKRKISMKKSGSGVEEKYTSTLSWYDEMSFLDSSIVIRKTMDNSVEKTFNSQPWEEIEEGENYVYNETSTKDSASNKLDRALECILEQKEEENEFTAFGASIALQLQKLPAENGYELMGEIQSLVTKKKLENIRQKRFRPMKIFSPRSSITNSSTPTDILSTAISDAEIDLETEYETII